VTPRRSRLLRFAVLAGRILLGVVFIVAAGPKIADPPAFAHMIANYRLFPASLIHAAALVLPWVEMFSGIALVLGVAWRTAGKLAAALLVAFLVSIGVNLARDRAVQCGCFDVHGPPKSHAQLIGEMRMVLLRDVALLGVAAFALAAGKTKEEAAPGPAR